MTTKTYASIALALILTAIAVPAEARRAPQENISVNYSSSVDRHTGNIASAFPHKIKHKRVVKRHIKAARKKFKTVKKGTVRHVRNSNHGTARRAIYHYHSPVRAVHGYARAVSYTAPNVEIVAHPEGCPRTSFCGCGVSLHIFGESIRELWLARNWLQFPESAPGPGKVAARRGHVFAILKDLGDGKVLAYDPNSGGHKTRIWVRKLTGYRVVDPGKKLVWAYAG